MPKPNTNEAHANQDPIETSRSGLRVPTPTGTLYILSIRAKLERQRLRRLKRHLKDWVLLTNAHIDRAAIEVVVKPF